MNEIRQNLPNITELPPLPVSDVWNLTRGGATRDVTREEFTEWYNIAPFYEYLDEISSTDKEGNEHVIYKISPVYFSLALAHRFLPVTFANATYYYSKDTSLYVQDTGTLGSWVRRQIEEAVLCEKLPNNFRPDAIVREVVGQASGVNVVEGDMYPFNQYPGFPVNNCVITFSQDGSITTEDYRPDMMFTRKSPINYNPHASTEKAERILKTWMDGSDDQGRPMWEYLVQIAAQAVYQSLPGNTPFKLAYMLVGEHDSGRSTFNTMLQWFFGQENISTIPLHMFTDRFAGGDLLGKYMNFGDDIPALRICDGNQFKQLVGIPVMSIERKFQNRYMARITAVHAYSANNLPPLEEEIYADEAWWSRWVILHWYGHFKRDPEWMKNNLDDEFFEGFLLLVIDEVCKIIRNHQLTLTQSPESVKIDWIGAETKLHEFIAMSIEFKPGCCIDKDCMLAALNEWAEKYMPTPSHMRDDEDAQIRWRREQKNRLPSSKAGLTQALKKEGILTKQFKYHRPGDPADAKPISKYDYWNVCFRDVIWAKAPVYQGVGV